MPFFPVPSALVRRPYTQTVAALRCLSQRRTSDGGMFIADQGSFEAAGIQSTVAASLRIAFPNVRNPTAMQRKLIRAMASGRDVLLQDDTGTGKSFTAMLALLSRLTEPVSGKDMRERLSGLLIVPHRDLAYQYLHWIHYMTLPEGDTPFSLATYAQVLVRSVNKASLQDLPLRMQEAIRSTSSEQDLLMHKRPRILIGTPNAILELMERQPEVLRLAKSSMVVVDEVDAFLRIPDSKLPKERRIAFQRKLDKHIPDLVRVLDRLYFTSRDKHVRLLARDNAIPGHRPQLIMISATLRSRLQGALFDTFGWIQRGKVLKLMRKRSSARPAHRLDRSALHHVLVVSKTGEIRNIAGARPVQPDVSGGAISIEKDRADIDDEADVFFDEDDDLELVDDVDNGEQIRLVDGRLSETDYLEELLHTPLAHDPATLEAVAATFALDVPRIALLVVPATAAVRKIISELRQMGVNAHPFDLVADEASRTSILSRMDEAADENPALIVATLATVRGIDLPDLSHVFMLGLPEGRMGDAYLHVAGRVGRFGRRGKVVTVLEEHHGERAGVRDTPKRMATLLSRIGVEPARLGHFE